MNKNISIVIISKNAEPTIKKVLDHATLLSDDVIVLDSFSDDSTKEICLKAGIKFKEGPWMGYGKQKNLANTWAKHNWILSLDADEVLSEGLIQELKQLKLSSKQVYSIPFKNIYCGREIRHGRWRNEKHVRLFCKTDISWDENDVHEGLKIAQQKVVLLENPIYHYSMNSKEEHLSKAKTYAKMGAERMHKQGKKASFIKIYINPIFRFVMDYIFSLGFLDGRLGLQIATIVAKETYWKYKNLREQS